MQSKAVLKVDRHRIEFERTLGALLEYKLCNRRPKQSLASDLVSPDSVNHLEFTVPQVCLLENDSPGKDNKWHIFSFEENNVADVSTAMQVPLSKHN